MLTSEVIKELERAIKEHGDGELKLQSLDNNEKDHFHGGVIWIAGCHWNYPKVSQITICFSYEPKGE